MGENKGHDFYQITLSQFSNDRGRSNGRPLTEAEMIKYNKKYGINPRAAENWKSAITNGLTEAERTKYNKKYGINPRVAKNWKSAITDGDFDIYADKGYFEVVFNVSPSVTESRSNEYNDQPLPGPVGMVIYLMTGNRSFTVSSRFIARTEAEAIQSYKYVNQLRAWMIPQSQGGVSGRPPILRFNGYKKQFYNIPVVLTSLTVTYPDDVDYIEIDGLAMVPIVQSVELSLLESHASALYDPAALRTQEDVAAYVSKENLTSEFSLELYREGKLIGY